ncbi:MAG: uroporphyrinogen decarboxylase, partial [Clostridiales bacterium]|nr:uroporphyrinogen decarboxylase [Clostridiales bacterium]
RMTRREAVKKALCHEYVSPVPYQMDLTEDMEAILAKAAGDADFFEHTGSYLRAARNESFVDLGGGRFADMFGVEWDRRQEGDFGVVSKYPVRDFDFGGYRFPEPDEALIRAKCEALAARKDFFTMYTIGFSLFERAWTLCSMEDVLCGFLLEPEFMGRLLDGILDYNLKVVKIVGEYDIDCVFWGDDWGQQKGLIMGYPSWKAFIRPRLEIMYRAVKDAGMFVAQHSCGDCSEVFPDLAALGLDIYNTFQPEIYDIAAFKEKYGKSIAFFGGISTQRLLPFATPEEVRRETRRILKILSAGGGYILAPTHGMTPDIPPENALAFLEVCQNQEGEG